MSRDLIERAQRGDRDAYEALAVACAPRLYRIASRILDDRATAEDAVQQTLVAIWRDLPSLRDADRFDAWSYRLVVNRCRSEARRSRRVQVSIVDVSEQVATSADQSAEIVVRDQLDRAFRSLSHDHRTVIVLRHYDGMSLDEIAEVLGIPRGTVGSRLHHALRAMRASIDAAERAELREGQPA